MKTSTQKRAKEPARRVNETARVHLAEVRAFPVINKVWIMEGTDNRKHHRNAQHVSHAGGLPVESIAKVEDVDNVGPEAHQGKR